MAALIATLYLLVLHGFLRATAAGLITDVPGQLGILYVVLRLRYRREPWTALGWALPARPLYWCVAALSGFSLGALVMAVENPGRFRLHFHDIGYAVVFGGVVAALIEETIFRGMILPIVLRHAQPMAAATITGVIFALYHGLYKGLPPGDILLWITLTGTTYGVMRIKSHSTLTAAVMHFAYNLALFIWQGA
ncbi:MAG: CPBP family intramembrane metalloprotease [Chloroflexi bacterium]|nr:CPBP family intramembrane metalloprotease [Chloroflexota bacterium]